MVSRGRKIALLKIVAQVNDLKPEVRPHLRTAVSNLVQQSYSKNASYYITTNILFIQ